MKRLLSFGLIVLALFSCVLFSACGDKYKKLEMTFYSVEGEAVEELSFMLDDDEDATQRIGVEFDGIKKKDIGQVKFYSIPSELIVDLNYSYSDNMCYVDILPVMPSSANAKLVVSHLASGKKAEIDLKIEQQCDSVNILNSKYVISIPEVEIEEKFVDFSKMINLVPFGSTDKVCFKVVANPDNVQTIPLNHEVLTDSTLMQGFNVSSSTPETFVEIYPVTYVEGYEDSTYKEHSDKILKIYFKNTLTQTNVDVLPKDYAGLSQEQIDELFANLQLLANDDHLNSFKLSLKHDETPLSETNFFDMYELDVVSTDEQKVFAFIDSNKDVVIEAKAHTQNLVEIKVVLKPINYVGEIYKIEKSIFVKGEVKADTIQVQKNGEIVSTAEKIDIFDYYEEGNSLGALFNFKPIANSGMPVYHDLNKMQIVVSPDIISSSNVVETPTLQGVEVGTKLYILNFHIFNDQLMFEYDENIQKMVSAPFSAESRIYVKYIDGNPAGEESTAFGIELRTVNQSSIEHWEALEPTKTSLNFNRLEGVKTMDLEAGTYSVDHGVGSYNPVGTNPEYIYLNRLEGLDNDESSVKYVNVKNRSVLGVDDVQIPKVDFRVVIEPLSDVDNGLTICAGLPIKDIDGEQVGLDSIVYNYDSSTDNDVVGLVFRQDTSIGDYLVTFYQEKVVKGSVICRVYENLEGLTTENIDLETNKKAFRNVNYKDVYSSADYIVASGQNLDIAVNLSSSVLDSNIVAGYRFDFEVGVDGGDGFVAVANKTEYFEKTHDDASLNNAILKFIKGTYIEGCPQYVFLTITVLTKTYDDIITESATLNEDNQFGICFFVYEEIQDDDISINHASMVRYFEKYLGVYYKEESTSNLKVEMVDNLWNYVTLSNGVNKVEWKIDNESGVIFDPQQEDCNLMFNLVIGSNEYTRVVKAYVYQFDKVYELQCVFKVKKPVITERVAIESEVSIRDNIDQDYYINLKNGETYTVLAKNYSSQGDVTHPEIVIQVADENGSAFIAREYFDINQTDCSITVKKVDNAHRFRLIVFAKDALQYVPSSDKSGYTYPSGFLLDLEGVDRGRYLNAYFVMDIELSDGTEDNPYLIKNANEFLQIDDTEAFRSAHYKLMTGISLDNATDKNEKTIFNFQGSIVTDGDNIYKVDGIYLNESCKYLFKGFAGEIENIQFVVNYSYNLTSNINTEDNLGLFDVNNGKLLDVSVTVNGGVDINSLNTTYYFGGLVGQNNNEIKYEKTFGANGTIILRGSSNVAFGGLVGKNVGAIIGLESETVDGDTDNEIKLNMATGREKTLSQIGIQSFLSKDSTIGGVVGLNTYDAENSLIGTIKNGFVQAIINAESTSNVGGVIGTNKQAQNDINVTKSGEYLSAIENVLDSDFKDKAIVNIKSNSTIKAKNNVGGIVGIDENGLFIECDFQILINSAKKVLITGNENVGGIAGKSNCGKFAYCSVMSYWWNYAALKEVDKSSVINDVPDILGQDNVGGIVGCAISSADILNATNTFVVNNRTIVFYSSVNAYLVAQKEVDGGKVGNIGGILSTDRSKNYKSIVFNAYFIGKLEGNVEYMVKTTNNGKETQNHYLCFDNNESSIYNAVYTLNLEQTGNEIIARLGCLKDGLLFAINTNPSLDYWWWNANINGGYIFITTETEGTNRLPIFDLSPDSIEVTVKNPKTANLDKVLVLDYYDLTLNTTLNDIQLATLNERLNRNQKVLDLLDIQTEPKGLGTVVLNVKSTNTNIIDISIDGRIIINGIGECELIFSSVLNPNVGNLTDRSVKVVVDYPIGDELNISTSRTDLSKIVSETQSITQHSSKQYYVITSGKTLYDFNEDGIEEEFKYKTKENINLQILVKYATNDETFMVGNYVSISGQNGTETHTGMDKVLTVTLDYKTPLTISVLKQIQNLIAKDYAFELEFKPFVTIAEEDIFYDSQIKRFNLSTLEGVSKMSFSYDEAIVYPNDTIYLTSHIVTDEKINDVDEILKLIKIKSVSNYKYEFDVLSGKYKITKISTNKDVGMFAVYIDDYSNYENGIQTIVFRIEFDDLMLTEEAILEINAIATRGIEEIVLDKLLYTIIPQRINKLEIKNFYYKNVQTETELVMDNVLKPNYPGKMQIDIVPDKGYYSYLEISDITGDEEILFIEIDENGNALTLHSDPSSDRKGIKIYNNQNLDKKRIFIRTQIDRYYSSKFHTVEVRAYSNNGTLLYSQTIDIDVKMLPEITVDYILPDGSIGETITSTNGERPKLLLANGVDANFMITTENANSELEHVIAAFDQGGAEDAELLSKYNFKLDVGNHYVLDRNDGTPDNDDIGKKIKITFTTYSYLDNGDFNKAECYVEFEIVPFVVHSVSVSNSIDNASQQEIYGYFDKPVKLDFYFDKHDISFYDTETQNEPFWDTVYTYAERKELNNAGTLGFIYSILRDLNAYYYDAGLNAYTKLQNNKYLMLNNSSVDENGYYTFDPAEIKQISLNNNQLEVSYDKDEDYNPKYLAVAFKLYFDTSANDWKIEEYNKDLLDAKNPYVINKNYNLNFIHATNWYEPTVIHDEEDFLEMVSGGRYILAKDLSFDTYSPLDVNLVEFDGNGRTITIKGFDKFNEEEINAGLFKQVYENMVVKNVVVNYETRLETNDNSYTFGMVNGNGIEYADLCNNLAINYSKLNFGGVAAENNGIITNCSVKGLIAISASVIEQKKFSSGGSYEINFYVGGVVAVNNTTGYITNSTSNLNIFAQANVGGFAYSNNGKIVSCAVEKDATIYGYNTNLDKTIVVRNAGFVVENSKEISMSYVNLEKSNVLYGAIYKGTMSSKDISAGFVYTNSGKILDAYVQMTETGINNNSFAGFVNQNTGTISRAYAYTNRGTKVDNNDSIFAPAGTENLINCIEFVVDKAGYTNGIKEGLTTVNANLRYDKTIYEQNGFVFGDNVNAMWLISSGDLAKLVSTLEKVEFVGTGDYNGLLPLYQEYDQDDNDDENKIVYKPNFGYYGTKENPYIITDLASWNEYFTKDPNGYFRIVKDIDFLEQGDNPSTSLVSFTGNIQGNNMILSNIMLYSTSSLDSLGLFKEMKGNSDPTKANAVRNLTITTTSVWASKTVSVGLLAGIIENFNIYNITIDAENVILVGGNAVGGLAGVVRGDFDIDYISSNVGANSTRASTLYNYSIYNSVNNKKSVSNNLQNVYYAGSVAGILDGYNGSYDINKDRNINKKYYMVRNVNVYGDVTIIGDTVGGAFGLVGERTYVKNCNVNVSGTLSGVQYSAGVVGENRGVLENISLIVADNIFDGSKNVSSGVVGFNLGGLIINANANANITKSGYGKVVGGIVGRDIYGTVNNVQFNGQLNAFFTGVIVGTSYKNTMLTDITSGYGSLSYECKANSSNLIPNDRVKYFAGTNEINNYENMTITKYTFDYVIDASKEFYTYENSKEGNDTLNVITRKTKVLGLIVGLSYETVGSNFEIAFDADQNMIINSTNNSLQDKIVSGKLEEAPDVGVILKQGKTQADDIRFVFDDVRTVYYETELSTVMYLTGAVVSSFDSWASTYSNDYVVFTTIPVTP